MPKMLDYALKYKRLGFSVIPMSGKKPLVGFADKSFTEEEIIKMWTKWPNANIAIKTENVFVVDIDLHDGGENGYNSIAMYPNPEHFLPTMRQKTPNGGLQLFYFKRNGRPRHQKIGWLPGVDIKAHNNNYVMVPPSRTKKGVYEWEVLERAGKIWTPTEMVEASEDLINAIEPPKNNSGWIKPNWQTKVKSKNKTADLFETIEEGFGSQNTGRNDKLAKFVGSLLTRGVDVDHIRSLARTTNQNSIDPLDEKELNATVESIIKKHSRNNS